MKRIGVPALCLWAFLGLLSGHGAAQNPYTPAPGSTERRAVLDALRSGLQTFPQRYNPGFQYRRDDVRVLYDQPIRFLVDWMKIQGSWAWVEVRGHNYGMRLCGLLQKKAGSWTVAGMVRPDRVVCTQDTPNCRDLRQWVYTQMRLKFPEVPAMIFPSVSEEHRSVLEALVSGSPECSWVFWVTHFGAGRDWVWIETEPYGGDGMSEFEPMGALLQKVSEGWVVREHRPCCGESADDPDGDNATRYYRKLRQRYPMAPPDIFPK